jgi:Rod binding domain-containing protein
MNPLAIETMSTKPVSETQKARAKAEKVANEFEAVFVKTLVGALRSTASVGGEGGGMFGEGPGSDTYASWFDQNISDELAKTRGIGIASTLLADMERHGAIEPDADATARMRRAAASGPLMANTAGLKGGFDDVL